MVATGSSHRSRMPWVNAIAGVAAVTIAVVGALTTATTPRWEPLVLAEAVSVLSATALLRFRQANRTIYLGWGEASLIIVVFLAPAGWVPAIIGSGTLLGQFLFRLRSGIPFAWRIAVNAANLTLAATAGAITAHAFATDGVTSVVPRTAIALLAGATAYFLVSIALVNLRQAETVAEFGRAVVRTARGKLPMVVGNISLGLIFVLLFHAHQMWLIVMPPVIVLTHQTYIYRSRAADERRTWRDFADIARSLNQLDEHGVAVAAVRGVVKVFGATSVEVWVDRLAAPAHGYRGAPFRDGFDVVEVVGNPVDRIVTPSASRILSIGGARVGEVRIWMPPGANLEARDDMVLAAIGEAIAAALHDASAHRALRTLAARSFHDSHHDLLTGVANRSTLVRDGSEALRVLPPDATVAMLVLGINRFKEVNDTLGHLAGDDLLRVTASRLAAFAMPGDLVARLTGDEFAIFVTDLDPYEPLPAALARARELADELAMPTEVAGLALAVEASVGIAISAVGDHDVVELIRRADIAMYQAKNSAGPIAVFGVGGTSDVVGDPERLSVVLDLREAMEHVDQLVLAVQPAIDLDTGAPTGVETLIRWRHPRRGLLAPADFLDIVNDSDLVAPFTRYVLSRALELAADWAEAGVPLPVSVNLSPRSLTDPSLPRDIDELLRQYDVKPSMLILEITESAVATGHPVVAEVLGALRALGVQLAVDDFGTGYSSLTFLTRVQVDEVKVDSSFVCAMVESLEAAAIVRTTVDLGRRLGVRVVAEGVETAEQRLALMELGCELAQGRYLVPPMDSGAATAMLRELVASATPHRPFPLPVQASA